MTPEPKQEVLAKFPQDHITDRVSNEAFSASEGDSPMDVNAISYLSGWRLHLMTLGLCLALFLVHMEVTIISTSIFAITNTLHGFDKTGWVLTAYLITYTGFIIVWAKLSDIIGRKTCYILTLMIFVIFSGACGACQTMSQLIICRAFQGGGAAGGFGLTITIVLEMVPKEKYPAYNALMAAVMSLSALSGPLFGGLISDHTSWRWVFLVNVPAGIVAAIVLFLAIPKGFPYHNLRPEFEKDEIKSPLARLDLIGAALLLAASLLITTGLLEGGVEWGWSSGASISLFVISGILWIVFFWWERVVTNSTNWKQEPLFPWRFVFNRAFMGVLLSNFLNGIAFFVLVFFIPQRFQTVNQISPWQAGLRLIPYTMLVSIGSVIANGIVGTGRIATIYVMWLFSIISTIGIGLLITLPAEAAVPARAYGYEALAGLGCGGTFGLAILLTPHVVEDRDRATGSGALMQFRLLGGGLGLAIATSAMNNHLTSRLSPILPPSQLSQLMKTATVIPLLPPAMRGIVIQAFSDGYNLQMKIMAVFSTLQLLSIGLMWRNPQISVVESKKR